uniref:Integrator complex subunit 4 n=1 Tax=Angiostrongylus costaricensis TaxID=334426 RepID=A0A0R3PKC3_ANGCS
LVFFTLLHRFLIVETTLRENLFKVLWCRKEEFIVIVRTEATTILGQFHSVSDAFLDQTLDKKMMKTVEVRFFYEDLVSVNTKKAVYIRMRLAVNKSSRTEWSSGKELNAPCPPSGLATSSDDDPESIVPRGACGAFVSALEDEFMSVRRAAVYSLGQLAATRPAFATTALDHLADMFNDEIAEVRLDAIAALTPLIVHGELQKEQLETVLKCLDDAVVDSRQALRQLLSKAEFADAECMRLCSRALLNCLHRFPSDKNHIYSCLSEVGARHAVFVHSMVRELLGLHLVYDTREQQIDDEFYIAKLILVLNAASNYEPIVSLLPECVLKHYRFLRAAAPELVAPIRIGMHFEDILWSRSSVLLNIIVSTYRFHFTTISVILFVFSLRDANAISAFNEPLASAARFIASLCQISSALESLTQVVLRGSGDVAEASNIIRQVCNTF